MIPKNAFEMILGLDTKVFAVKTVASLVLKAIEIDRDNIRIEKYLIKQNITIRL